MEALSALYSFPGGYASDKLGYKYALLLFNLIAMTSYVVVIDIPNWQAVILGAILFVSWTAASTAKLIIDTFGMGQSLLPFFNAITYPAANFLVAFGFGLSGKLCFAFFGQDLGRAAYLPKKRNQQRSKQL